MFGSVVRLLVISREFTKIFVRPKSVIVQESVASVVRLEIALFVVVTAPPFSECFLTALAIPLPKLERSGFFFTALIATLPL